MRDTAEVQVRSTVLVLMVVRLSRLAHLRLPSHWMRYFLSGSSKQALLGGSAWMLQKVLPELRSASRSLRPSLPFSTTVSTRQPPFRPRPSPRRRRALRRGRRSGRP